MTSRVGPATATARLEQLMAELRFWTSTMKIIQPIIQNRIDQATDSLALVEAEIGR